MLSSSRLSLRLSLRLPGRALTPLLSSRASARLQARPALQLLPSAAAPARPYATSRASPSKTAAFKAETRQLLDIVTNSLYSDKDVFVRELISNSSDACEKLRHLQATNAGGLAERGDGAELEIRIGVDEAAKTITIQDSGVGMTAEELEANLGTIARSGSREFAASADSEMGDIIGKFGVGFYAAFMVGSKVTVVSRSAKEEVGFGSVWESDGGGEFSVRAATETDDVDTETVEVILEEAKDGKEAVTEKSTTTTPRTKTGSTITIHLKETDYEFGTKGRIEEILKKHSNFVQFPIYLNGERVNTMEAVWSQMPSEVKADTHKAFYKFVTGGFDDPMYHLHYRADAPLEIKTLLYVPSFHSEKYGMGRMQPGVSLYSRKVLIEKDSPDILPEWMRFVKGVVDSEDLPLSISREKSQDSRLIAKLKTALTRRFISELAKFAKKDSEKFKTVFWPEFGSFLKEGVCQDYQFQEPLAKLLMFESSKNKKGELTTLEEYVGRCPPEQKDIYYLCAPSRELAESSPYMEAFEGSNKEVIFLYQPLDDFVFSNLRQFEQRQLVTAEKGGLEVDGKEDADEKKEGEEGKDDEEEGDGKKEGEKGEKLSKEEGEKLCAWIRGIALPERVEECKTTTRLASSPAIVTGHESGALRRMMKMVDGAAENGGGSGDLGKQVLEINPKHPLIRALSVMSAEGGDKEELAKIMTEQVFNNAIISAGIVDDARTLVPNIDKLLMAMVDKK